QFGPNEDFERYPRPLQKDLQACAADGVDAVFAPEPATMYPEGFRTFVEVTELQDLLCGASRPGHFRGVATVVLKLFQIVQPDVAYFGQKVAQQVCVIQKMIRDLDLPVAVRVCPIIREADGLALSSRNQYLTPEQRQRAPVLYQALQQARELIDRGERNPVRVQGLLKDCLTIAGTVLDYAAVV